MAENESVRDDSEAPVAWVTGSGGARVGRAVATHLASHGYRIALHARFSVDEATAAAETFTKASLPCMVTNGDVSDWSAMSHAVDAIYNRWGRLDVVIHCAAIWDWKSLEETTANDVRRHLEINTLGSFSVAKSAGLKMVQQPSGGAIVLIGDWAVARPYPDFSAYFAGKGAIETIVRSMAVELATRNPAVRVNGILPGPVLLDATISAEAAEKIRQSSLLQKHGQPEHVATAARFLAEHEFITGVCLPVDGGRTIWAGNDTDRIAHPSYLRSES
jgi:NAD(P)-dependent dehydrogenase (short-subunit alcohol dehydrogenase family)